MRIKYDLTLIKFISFFETITKATVKDCFIDSNKQLVFVVPENEVSKVVGDRGYKIKRLEAQLKRKIKILGYNPEITAFVQNLIQPMKAKMIKEENNIITITSPDLKTRGMLIGRGAQNLRNYEAITQRYFEIKEIKVI